MTAGLVTTLQVRTSSYQLVAATGEIYRTTEESVYGSVAVLGVRHRWWITANRPGGRRLAQGRAFTRTGAWGAAIRAAHQHSAGRGAS